MASSNRLPSRFWTPIVTTYGYGEVLTPLRALRVHHPMLAYCAKVMRLTKVDLQSCYGWDLDRADFFFLTTRRLTAASFRHGGRVGVGVSAALLLAVLRRIRTAMAHPEFLSEYLKPAERSEWIWRFLGWIVEHVYLHEMAHALRGHAVYRMPDIGPCAMHDLRDEPAHYLELDADLHALDMWVHITQHASDFPRRKTALLQDLYFQKLFTLLMLYQTLDSPTRSLRRKMHQRHPPPIHRALLLSEMLLHVVPERYNMPRRIVENVHAQAWWEASVAARACGLMRNRWWGASSRRQGVRSYARMVNHYLRYAEPTFDRFVAGLPEDLV